MSGELKAFFEPKSVVLVGASRAKGRAGVAPPVRFHSAIHNMSRFYRGKTFVVDLSGRLSVAVKSFRQVPKKSDLAVLMPPPELALKHLRKLLDRQVKAIVATTGGYSPEQREQLARFAAKKGVRVLGPNTLVGVMNTANGLCATLERDIMPRRGNVAIISQSGGVAAAILDWAWFYGIGISKFASMGDGIDVDGAELIEYLARDKDTRVICLYVDGVREGRRLIDALREAVKQKPVVVLKGGVAQGGARRVFSRTASLVGRDEIFSAALEQAGAIRARNIEELFDVANALAKQPPMHGSRVAIVSNISDHAILAVDAIHREGLALASFSDKAAKAISERYPSMIVANPIDLSADARSERYEFVLEKALADPNVDGALVINMLESCSLEPEDVRAVAEVACKFRDKPIVDVTMGGEDYTLVHKVLKDTNVPTYNLPDRAARALGALHLYWKIRERVAEK